MTLRSAPVGHAVCNIAVPVTVIDAPSSQEVEPKRVAPRRDAANRRRGEVGRQDQDVGLGMRGPIPEVLTA